MKRISLFCSILFLWAAVALTALCPDKTVQIPMRDGFSLNTDLYFPPDFEPKQLPCVLVRSPSGRKAPFILENTKLVNHGYVVAIQETRCVADFDGKTFPYFSDGWSTLQDGYDTVEWLAQSPYCNGKIGTTGVSAAGITQILMAPSSPPSLKCQYIGVAPSSLYHHAIYHGGQFVKEQVEGWLSYYGKDYGVQGFARSHPFYNEFWGTLNANVVAHQVKAPALFYGGWYDIFLQGTLDAFAARQEEGGVGAKGEQKLIIGPWTHFWPMESKFGEYAYPPASQQPPVDFSPAAWFDQHLKSGGPKSPSSPPVTYYVMGPLDGSPSRGNIWKSAESWPPPANETPFYLTAERGLRKGEQEASDTFFSYAYDPMNPTPTIGGRNLFIEAGPKDQAPIEARDDVLLFTTGPLEKDLIVTGRMKAVLYVSSDCPDTDIAIRLTDLYPDGKSVLISDGIARLAVTGEEERGEVRKVEVDLWSTSLAFAKGHRIRVIVSSSNFPRFERNLNVGLVGADAGRYAIARNTIYAGPDFPSRVILPIEP